MSQPTDFDIVPVAPHVDLVLFDNVLSCYPSDKDITATYTLGEAVAQSTWDWIGLFRCDWRYLGDYVAYRWASMWSPDQTALLRRSVTFPAKSSQTFDDWRTQFQLLYVSNGNHVVGVSTFFCRMPPEMIEDFNISLLFKETQLFNASTSGKQKGKSLKRLRDSYDMVDDTSLPALPKRRPVSKQKITKIYRNTESLVNIQPSRITDQFNVVEVYPTDEGLAFSISQLYKERRVKVFDVDWKSKNTSCFPKPDLPNMTTDSCLRSIEYPTLLCLKTGPQAFLESLSNHTGACTSCNVAKTLVSDLVIQSDLHERKLAMMDGILKELKHSEKQEQQTTSSTLCWSEWYSKRLETENQQLRVQIKHLKEQNTIRAPVQHTPVPDLMDGWAVWEPRRLARLKKAVCKQSRTIGLLKQTVQTKNQQIMTTKEQMKQLRNMLQAADKTADKFHKLSDDLSVRIKEVLSERAKDHTNDWRQFVRNFQESTTQTVSPPSSAISVTETVAVQAGTSKSKASTRHHIKNKHMSKVLRCEGQPKSKLHKERSQAEQCPTCGLKFSVKADRHVIEEHLVFHARANK